LRCTRRTATCSSSSSWHLTSARTSTAARSETAVRVGSKITTSGLSSITTQMSSRVAHFGPAAG
jgi:hypothetical protein